MDELLQAFCATLESAFNGLIAMDPEAKHRLADMQGKVIRIRLKEIDLSLTLIPTSDGVMVYPLYDAEPDTEIVGTPMGLINLGLGNKSALFTGEVEINGDVKLGQQVNRLLDQLHIDWEEQLSHLTGDAVAHHLGRAARGTLQWGTQALGGLATKLTEYLQHESRDLPLHDEVEPFLTQVDGLRDDLARLEARIKRIQHTLGNEE
ncbi:MAG: SCP2 sterol-binding domain-containing protein [Gammaproteobacteria bacterium]|nr:SCP2 sterol-binding domain-containing protein [Gammaproteobacteria bacterium]